MPKIKTEVRVPPLSVAAPKVMTRSQITDLANAIKNREGAYGVRRVERAADEIPNLEKLYTPQALADAFSGDNARALMTMNPANFEKYAAPIGDSFKLDIYQPEQGRRLQTRGEGLLPPITGDEYIKHLAQIKQQGGFSDIPYLNVNKEEQGLPDYPFISGHEGRHRNRAMAASGEQAGLVQFLPRAEFREPFPRRMSEQYIDAIRKEMGLSGNFVLPQKYHIPSDTSLNDVVVNRPAIELPDLYAQGGLVDSAPEEAIKNTVTDPQAYKMLDMDLANLALMNQQMQPPRHMAEGGFLNDIYNNVIPAHARTYAESMFGNRSPINENNFSSSELDMMRDAIASSRRDRTITNQRLYQEQLAAAKNDKERMNVVSQGPSTKIDQTVGYQHYPNSGDQSTRDDNNFGYDSAVRNTLGRFAYEKDANGNLIATDTYKFRDDLPGQTRPSSDYAKMSTFEKLKTLYDDSSKDKAGVGTLLSRMGSAFMGADSRPVNVNLGKAPFAHGGAARHPSPEEMRIEMIERRYAKA